MHIRPYQKEDRAACIAIFESNAPLYFDPSELAVLENWLNGKDEGRHSYKENVVERFYVAEINATVVGCGGYYIPSAEQRGNMVWGMVDRQYHGQGIGKELLLHRMREIRELYPGCAISLDTSQYTYPFFMKLGFVVTKVQKDCYGPGLDRYDMELNASAATAM
jgi:[ribosomal protein S18]-alanine N-acetyltransferase